MNQKYSNENSNIITLDQLANKKNSIPERSSRLTQSKPYWHAAIDFEAYKTEEVTLPKTTDVLVVGSGFTGLSAALTVIKRDRSVIVLDAEYLGAGASTRNGGQLGSGNQKFRVKQLIKMFGEKKAVKLLKEGVNMLNYIEALIEEEKIQCFFKRTGRFRGAIRPEHYEAMARDMDDLKHYINVESHAVPKSEQHREINSDFFYGGSVLPDDASLHPGRYHNGLINRLKGYGVVLKGNTPVLHIEPNSNGFIVTTKDEKIQAKNVIVATNGYTRKLHSHLSKRIVKVQSALVATAPLSPERIDNLMPTGRMYGNTAKVFSYFRIAPDEPRIIWGGRVGRLCKPGTDDAFSHLAKDLLKVFPDLEDAPVSHGWSGNIGYTFDELPHLGKTPDGIHYAMGYCGTGVTRSTYFGHKIAQQILNSPEGSTAFDDISFPSHPFHFVADYTVPFFEGWYRLRDRFNF